MVNTNAVYMSRLSLLQDKNIVRQSLENIGETEKQHFVKCRASADAPKIPADWRAYGDKRAPSQCSGALLVVKSCIGWRKERIRLERVMYRERVT